MWPRFLELRRLEIEFLANTAYHCCYCLLVVTARRFYRLLGIAEPAIGRHPQAAASVRYWWSRGRWRAVAMGRRTDLPRRCLLWPHYLHCVRLRHRPAHLPRLRPRLRPIDRRRASAANKWVRQPGGAVWDKHCREVVPGTGIRLPGTSAVRLRRNLVIECSYLIIVCVISAYGVNPLTPTVAIWVQL